MSDHDEATCPFCCHMRESRLRRIDSDLSMAAVNPGTAGSEGPSEPAAHLPPGEPGRPSTEGAL